MDDRKDNADSARGGRFSSCIVFEGRLGSGLDPVGRTGLLFRRSARYDAVAKCEYVEFQVGSLGGILDWQREVKKNVSIPF